MSNEAKLYWLTRLDSIQTVFGVLFFLSMVGLIVFYVVLYLEDYREKQHQKFKNIVKICWITVIISTFVGCFLPSRNEAIIIIAGGKVLTFTEKDSSLNKLPSQTTEIISKLIEEELKKLK